MISFRCHSCRAMLLRLDHESGRVVPCPTCGRDLTVPTPDEADEANAPEAKEAEPAREREPKRDSVPIEECRFCGCPMSVPFNLLGREVQCPDCKATVRATEEVRRRRPIRRFRGRSYECPDCGTDERPYRKSDIAPAGWVLFAVLMVFFFPLFWIGLLINETYWVCPECGSRFHRYPYY